MAERLNIKSAILNNCLLLITVLISNPVYAEYNPSILDTIDYTHPFWYFLSLLVILLLFKIKAMIIKSRPRLLLKSLYSRIDLNDENDAISLSYSHQSNPHIELKLANIIQSDVFLNDKLINTINKTVDNGFNCEINNAIQHALTTESRFKMTDKRIRKIHIVISCSHYKKYTICLYLRKGNLRLTRDKYQSVIKSLTQWCWLIATAINPENTEVKTESEITSDKRSVSS